MIVLVMAAIVNEESGRYGDLPWFLCEVVNRCAGGSSDVFAC